MNRIAIAVDDIGVVLKRVKLDLQGKSDLLISQVPGNARCELVDDEIGLHEIAECGDVDGYGSSEEKAAVAARNNHHSAKVVEHYGADQDRQVIHIPISVENEGAGDE